MADARRARFDAGYRRSEDSAFLLRVLWGKSYIVLPEVWYVYDELASATARGLLAGYQYRMRVLWSYRRRHPFAALYGVVNAWVKQTIYRLAFLLGLSDRLIARRSQAPSLAERRRFEQARDIVSAVRRDTFD
jgi:hypothetical protein